MRIILNQRYSTTCTQVIPETEQTLTKIIKGGPNHLNAQSVVHVRRIIFPNATTNKEITSLSRPMGRRKVRDHQRGSRALGEIKEALGGLLWAKKVEEQSHIRDAESSIPKKGQ